MRINLELQDTGDNEFMYKIITDPKVNELSEKEVRDLFKTSAAFRCFDKMAAAMENNSDIMGSFYNA